MKATLKQHRQSPRKVRLVADHIKRKPVEAARVELDHLTKKAAEPIKKLLNSAAANAEHNDDKDPSNLYIKNITVDQGPTYKRQMPRARGRATPIRKRTSHITVRLAEQTNGNSK